MLGGFLMKLKRLLLFFLMLIVTLAMAACANAEIVSEGIKASGAISTNNVSIASELGGKVLEINANEGDSVQEGDILFRLDDSLLAAQESQAKASIETARAALETANAQYASAQAQYDLIYQESRLQEKQTRNIEWTVDPPEEFDLPVWYYQRNETIEAAKAEVESAKKALAVEQTALENELKNASNSDFVSVEKRLAEAKAAFISAKLTLEQAQNALDKTELEKAAQDLLDSAETELDSAQLEYNRLLNKSSAERVLEARASVAAAKARLDNAEDYLAQLQMGEYSPRMIAAQASLEQAKTGVAQAQANLTQAEAALKVTQIQLSKTVVKAPVSGIVFSRNLEVGELVAAGANVMTVGQLDKVDLIVYIPETQYGQISLGQKVVVAVDSYPNRTFTGNVIHIADQAEFTPRNVSTVDGRKATVFAVKISVPNPSGELKAGMPADVSFLTVAENN
jgi:HlyD family secretion protein